MKNNPLKYTDPSGFFFKKIFRAIKKAFKQTVRELKAIHNAVQTILKVTGDIGYHIMYSSVVKNFFRKYAWARQVGMVVASYFGGPIGAAAFSAYLTEIQGGSFSDSLKAAAITFASAYVANGVANKVGSAYGITA